MLSNKQKRFLKNKANPLKPLVQIGKNGLTTPVLTDLQGALAKHELIKVTLLQNSPLTASELEAQLVAQVDGLTIVQTMGRVLTLYKPASKVKYRILSTEVAAQK